VETVNLNPKNKAQHFRDGPHGLWTLSP